MVADDSGTSSPPRRRHQGVRDDIASDSGDVDTSTTALIDRWKFEHDMEEAMDEDEAAAPLTVELTDTVKTQHEQEYLDWQHGIASAMESAVGPSNVSSVLLRESYAPDLVRFVLLFRFATKSAAATWHQSDERLTWLKKLRDTSFHNEAFQGGLSRSSSEPFPIFDIGDRQRQSLPQQRWRIAFIVWLQVFCLVELLGVILPLTLQHANWSSLSLHLQILVSTALTTLLMETVTMRLFLGAAHFFRFLRHSS